MKTQFDPITYLDQHEAQVGNYRIVAYLAQDYDCTHPLDDCDGMGKVIGRGKYQTRNHDECEFFDAVGLDRYGDLDLDHDAVQVRVTWQYRAWVNSLTDDQLAAVFEDVVRLRDALLNLTPVDYYEAGDYVVAAMYAAVKHTDELHIATAIHDWPDVNLVWEEAWRDARAAGEIGDQDAILLDVYDHSGITWKIHGGHPQCRWDTSSNAGVWVPDACARAEIDDRVAKGMNRREEAVKMAVEALNVYNDWLAGNCYGVIAEVYDQDDNLVYDDTCWGFVGNEYAEEELERVFKATVEWAEERVQRDRADNRFRDAMANAL